MKRLRSTVAGGLQAGHIDSLKLLELPKGHSPQVNYDVGGRRWAPNAEIHAFEPLAQHVIKYNETTARLKNVYLHSLALGSKPGYVKMEVMDFTEASGLLPLTGEDRT